MRFIKRKKGNKEYFYLQYSFRKGNKVITKEKYLGKNIPKNIEKMKEQMKEDYKKEVSKKLNKIKEYFQKEWDKLPKSIQEKEKEEIAIAFTYNTNAIEGSTITLNEAREIIHSRIAPNKPLKDIRETEAHSKFFLQMLKKKEKITIKLILRWHKDIFGETKQDITGKFRDYLVRVSNYIAPDWQDVENLMKQLIKFINKAKMNPVELAARTHYRFEKIHPFGDGNGRIGRLLMNHILWHNKYPMLIIEYKKRKAYYRALERDEEYFASYFIRKYLTINKQKEH